jgi:hypothetical protein
VRRSRQAVWREIDGRVIGLDLRTGRYFSLNSTATFLWRLLEDETKAAAMVDALVSEHDVDRARATEDVDSFVSSLRQHDLIES